MRSRFRLRLVSHIVAFSFYLSLFPIPGLKGVPEAEAKVSPLHMITRQVKKANMLMMLDTSGSMTGVPGEPFSAATELGVDCDLGEDCREVSQTGQCAQSINTFTGQQRLCSNDSQCRVGGCKFGGDPCLVDFDCPSVGSVCELSGKPCQYNADCGAQSGTCSGTGAACSSIQPCASSGTCADPMVVPAVTCNFPGGQCPVRYCSDKPTLTCATDSDCQAAAPPAAPPTTGLQVHYKYDEAAASTTVIDHAGGDNTGTFGGAGPQRTTGYGPSGSSFDVSGTGSFARVTTNLQLGNSVTISTWYNTYGSYDKMLVNWAGGYGLTVWSDNSLGLMLGGNFSTWGQTAAGAVPSNAWVHLAASWDGSQVKLYINGAPVKTAAITQTIATQTKELVVGSDAGPTYYRPSHGKIDNTRIYNTALTDAEVQSIYTGENAAAAGGLVAHLNFENNVNDQTANGFNGIREGTTTYVAGPVGQALKLDGTSGCLTIPSAKNSLADIHGDFSVAYYVYRESTAARNDMVFRSGGGWNPTIGIYSEVTNNWTTTWFGNDVNQMGEASKVIGAGAWHHVAMTLKGDVITYYLDGVQVNQDTGVTPPGNATPLSVGEPWILGCVSHGGADRRDWAAIRLDEFRIYNKAIDAAEVSALANGGGLVGEWKFNEGTGTTAADSSGNNNTGTLSNATNWTSSGKQGAAFSGSWGTNVTIPPSASMNTINNEISFASWIKPPTTSSCNWMHLFTRAGGEPVSRITESYTGACRINFDGSGDHFEPTNIIPKGSWSHVALTYNQVTHTGKVYLNGTLIGTKTDYTMGITPGVATYINSDNTGAGGFGDLVFDDTKIYNRVISDSEVATLAAGAPAASSPLLGHWKFDEGTGLTVSDQSVYNNPIQNYCVDSAGANPNQTGVGCSGNGLPVWGAGHSAPATDRSVNYIYWQYGQVPASVLDGKLSNKVSVSAWVKKTGLATNRWIVHQQAADNTDADGISLFIDGSNKWSFSMPNNQVIRDTVAIVPDAWVHLAGTYDGTTMSLYKNGVLANSQANSYTFSANNQPITFGTGRNFNKTDWGEYFDGFISEVAIWNTALTTGEITALAAGGPPGGGGYCKPNPCTGGTNTCSTLPNLCKGGQVNQCLGVNTTDVCAINSTSKGPAKMCRFAQIFCAVDANCFGNPGIQSFPGDECVPATSRSVVAKRVLRKTMLANSDIMNFGLMSFSQGSADGTTWDQNGDTVIDANDKDSWPDDYYFPYFKVTKNVGGSSVDEERFFSRDELVQNGCYDGVNEPKSPCTVGTITYTLKPAPYPNSRYTVYMHGSFASAEQGFCGDKCVVHAVSQGWLIREDINDDRHTDARGTGRFAGALYTYPVPNGDYDPNDQPFFLKSFQSRSTKIGGQDYMYFKPRDDYYANAQGGANRPPIRGAQCATTCSADCGGSWDENLTPLLDSSDDPVIGVANIKKMLPLLDKARDGGYMHFGPSPVGCALINDFASGPTPAPADKKKHSAWNYLEDVRAADHIPCRDDFVVLVTDGESSGPGDVEADGTTRCDNPDCRVQWDDPNAAVGPTCQCKAVINALQLRKPVAQGGLNVKTYVVGFSPDANGTWSPAGVINENIARAGGTCRVPIDDTGNPSVDRDRCLFPANNETELQNALQAVIFDAIKGSYSTSPSSAISGVQVDDKKITPGGVLFDARVDFPSWRGHLLAYDTTDIDAVSLQPKMLWDAGSPLNFPDPNDPIAKDPITNVPGSYSQWTGWTHRHVYTSSGANMIEFQIDKNGGAILNRDELKALGLGNTPEEAERIAQWMLGDPRQRNKAVLGAFINSTPIEVGPAGLSPLPGGKSFFDRQKNRVSLVYAASDDGLLHAFFTRNATVNGRDYRGGEEAFAYIPPDMLRAVTDMYTQGGQKADPREHVFGLTSSPKMKNVCWKNCEDDATAEWKSILIMTDGWGGKEAFMLDVTDPFTAGTFSNPPLKLLWHTDYVSSSDVASYDAYQGSTVSVPAFYYGKNSTKTDYRVIYASGYASTPPTNARQGITLMSTSARDGKLLDSATITPPTTCPNITLTTLTDVASARNFDFREQQQMLAAYFGDTWGNLWRYAPAQTGPKDYTGTTGTMSLVKAFGCDQPLHFAPTVVQLDRDDPLNHPGEVYVVQATNSALDPETDAFAPSKLIIRKESRTSTSGGVSPDNTWTPGGQLEYVAGTSTLCGIWDPTGNSGAGSCTQVLPPNARPTGTPLAILKADGTGFLIMSIWFAPALNICAFGRSYLLLHTMDVGGKSFKQQAGIGLVNEAVTSAVIVDKKVVYTDSQGKVHDVTSELNQTFLSGGAISDTSRNGGLRFQQTGWLEVP
jgi:hypothetical protein